MTLPAISNIDLEALHRALAAFRHTYRREASDVVRFEALLDAMWDVFIQPDETATRDACSVSPRWKRLPLKDNLDTGNARHKPYEPFADALLSAVKDCDAYRAYIGPRPIDGLGEGLLGWLVQRGVFSAEDAQELGVAVGAGTVNLYDALCRWLIRRPGDTVLFPPISYGFFVPQVTRAGGRIAVLPERRWWLDPGRHVGGLVRDLESKQLDRWRFTMPERLQQYGLTMANVRGVRAEPFERAIRQNLTFLQTTKDPRDVENFVANIATEVLFGGHRQAYEDAQGQRDLCFVGPARVVAFFFTNPDTFGRIYPASETELLASVLAERQIALIEDWAYHSLGAFPEALGSVVARAADVYLLVGFSKPLAVADTRIGLMVAKKRALKPLYRVLENALGFVSTRTQMALKHAFADPGDLNAFLERTWSEPGGYADSRSLALACFDGCRSRHLEPAEAARCRRRLEAFARDAYPELPERHVLRFAERGLSDWFFVPERPGAGFFLVVDCTPMVERPPRLLKDVIQGSFEVFATLAVLFGVRCIPEECMGNLSFSGGRHLRFSFSVDETFLMDCALTMYLGFAQLDSAEPMTAQG